MNIKYYKWFRHHPSVRFPVMVDIDGKKFLIRSLNPEVLPGHAHNNLLTNEGWVKTTREDAILILIQFSK